MEHIFVHVVCSEDGGSADMLLGVLVALDKVYSKGTELPCNGSCYLCESFFLLMLHTRVGVSG